MTRIQTMLAMAATALLLGSAAADAQRWREHRPGWGEAPFGPGAAFMIERLDLSEGQQAELKALFEARHESHAETHKALHEARRALEKQIRAEVFDEAAIRAAAAAVAALEADLAVARALGAQEMRKILTPEQLAELEAMQEMRSEFRRFRRDHRGPRGHGLRPPPVDGE